MSPPILALIRVDLTGWLTVPKWPGVKLERHESCEHVNVCRQCSKRIKKDRCFRDNISVYPRARVIDVHKILDDTAVFSLMAGKRGTMT